MNKAGIIIANLAAICWGFVYAQTEAVVNKLSPLTTLSAFYIFGAIILSPVFIMNKHEILSLDKNGIKELGLAVIGTMIAELLIIYSIKFLGGSEASFIEISYPLWTIIFSMILLKSYPNYQMIAGGIMIMIGSYIISRAIN